jgi:hypothetical protein
MIDLWAPNLQVLDNVVVSAEELGEMEEVVRELANADPEKRAATLGYLEATDLAMKYYLAKATDLDKQLIEGASRGAIKTLRQARPPKPKVEPTEPKQTVGPISPEIIAVALYKAFAENTKGKVKGEPGGARRTEIRGFWDLREVARKVLSHG